MICYLQHEKVPEYLMQQVWCNGSDDIFLIVDYFHVNDVHKQSTSWKLYSLTLVHLLQSHAVSV